MLFLINIYQDFFIGNVTKDRMFRITYSMVEQLTGRSTPVQFNNYAAGSLWCDPTPSIADNTIPPPGNLDL